MRDQPPEVSPATATPGRSGAMAQAAMTASGAMSPSAILAEASSLSEALPDFDQVVSVLHFLDERGQQLGRLLRVGGECREPRRERRQLHAPLAVDPDQGDRLPGEPSDQMAQIHGLARQRCAEGEL